MPTKTATVLLFEDTDAIAALFKKNFDAQAARDLRLKVFPLSAAAHKKDGPFEDRLLASIKAAPYYKDLVLIVTDRDLSTKSDHWGGLSEAAVSTAARQLGVPVATYRQAAQVPEDALRRIPGDGLIELGTGSAAQANAERARFVAMLARGFIELDRCLESMEEHSKKRKGAKAVAADMASPGVLLAAVLKHPEVASHLDTFACGDQGAIAEILRFSKINEGMTAHNRNRLVAAVGVWLADLVMSYPGVLLNATAAASYLDISEDGFAKGAVQKTFAAALYENLPFADPSRPLWWRHLLDGVIDEHDCSSGLEVAQKLKIRGLKYCPCYVDPNLHAGFLCMATNRPLSAENSSGQVRWFPPGADLARLTKSTYRKLRPWIAT